MKKGNTSEKLDYFLFGIYLFFFISIVFSLRAISSISIGLILLTGLIGKRYYDLQFSHKKNFLFFLCGCGLLFILQCCALLYTQNTSEGWKLLQRSSGLIFIPFAVFASHKFLTHQMFQKLFLSFAVILMAASLYCLIISGIHFFSGASITVFFYHDLVKPLSQHAIQFSILVFIALTFLIGKYRERKLVRPRFLLTPMIIFLSFFLLLLSSKLIITVYILFLLTFFLNKQFITSKNSIIALALTALVAITILTANPVGNRFRAIFTGNYMLFTQKEFDPGIHFNGLQFRLLQWRFTGEILSERHAWLPGLTPGDVQSFLDRKYIETRMYTGITGTSNHGFLGYHTHNQFLQVTLENGLPALLIFFFIGYSLIMLASENKGKELKWFIALLLIYCFTDAPLATQYGLVIFTFFPAFIYFGSSVSAEQNPPFKPVKFQKRRSQHDLPETVSAKQPN